MSPPLQTASVEPFAETILAFATLAHLQAWQPNSSSKHDGRLILLKGTSAPFDGGERWYRIDVTGTAVGDGRIQIAGGPAQAVPTELDETTIPSGTLTFDDDPWDAAVTYSPGAVAVRGYNMFVLGGASTSLNQDPNSGSPWLFAVGLRGLPSGFSVPLAAIANDNEYRVLVPANLNLTAIRMLGNASGSFTLTPWVAAGVPTVADSIVGAGVKPALSSAAIGVHTNFASYAATSLVQGHVMIIKVTGVTTTTSAVVAFEGTLP